MITVLPLKDKLKRKLMPRNGEHNFSTDGNLRNVTCLLYSYHKPFILLYFKQ